MRIPTASELVKAAKEGLGVVGDRQLDLALYSKYGVSPGQPLVNKWANDRGSPNYEYTVLLLLAAGWLRLDRPEGEVLDEAAEAAKAAEAAAEDLGEPESPAPRVWRPL